MSNQIILLELNELCFEYVKYYIERGHLPNFASALSAHGYSETTSETQYEELEPWVQWVTAHTGLSFDEHKVFRLGDFVQTDFPQIWELLEAEGLRVGAVSPMNAANRMKKPAFFMPDPWTKTPAFGGPLFRALGQAISQTVNDNAQDRITLKSALVLLLGLARYAYPATYGSYLKDVLHSRGRPWRRAMVLDRLIANVFEREWERTRPDFSSLFLNGAAFTQHHYMFSSPAYDGGQSNPSWYVKPGEDPMLDMYQLYDDILGRMLRLNVRVMISTGLHQIPYGQTTYYWRLRNHAQTLNKWQVPFQDIQPRMTRDFLVVCKDEAEAETAADILGAVKAQDGEALFDVDRRQTDLFVTLIYPSDIPAGFSVQINGRKYEKFDLEVAFVAIKNGHHHGVGYFLDSGEQVENRLESFPLTELRDRIISQAGVSRV